MNAHEMCTGNEELQLIKILLEEACRQWCDFIEECPERLTGEGFGDFFLEIYFEKKDEYAKELREIRSEANADTARLDNNAEWSMRSGESENELER